MKASEIEEMVLNGEPLWVIFPFSLRNPQTFQVGGKRITEKQFQAIKSKYNWNLEQFDRKHKRTIKKD